MFYPLLLHLSKYMAVHYAFLIGFVAVALLVLDNLRRSQGLKFALGYGGFGLIVVLGMFSAAALATKGAGAIVTIALLLLVAYIMYAGPRVAAAWPKRPPRKELLPPPPPPEGQAEAPEGGRSPSSAAESGEDAQAEIMREATPPPTPAAEEEARAFCAFCGGCLEEGFLFCPRCGKGTEIALECARCGTRICLSCSGEYRHCPGCGAPLPRPQPPRPEPAE